MRKARSLSFISYRSKKTNMVNDHSNFVNQPKRLVSKIFEFLVPTRSCVFKSYHYL